MRGFGQIAAVLCICGTPAPGADSPVKGQPAATRADFARLMLGMFAMSFKGYPLTFQYIGRAEAPQGKAQ
jgi:hypothetical protein